MSPLVAGRALAPEAADPSLVAKGAGGSFGGRFMRLKREGPRGGLDPLLFDVLIISLRIPSRAGGSIIGLAKARGPVGAAPVAGVDSGPRPLEIDAI